jgi:ribosomal protein L18
MQKSESSQTMDNLKSIATQQYSTEPRRRRAHTRSHRRLLDCQVCTTRLIIGLTYGSLRICQVMPLTKRHTVLAVVEMVVAETVANYQWQWRLSMVVAVMVVAMAVVDYQ